MNIVVENSILTLGKDMYLLVKRGQTKIHSIQKKLLKINIDFFLQLIFCFYFTFILFFVIKYYNLLNNIYYKIIKYIIKNNLF